MQYNNASPLISVIIPVYNLGGYINRCLQSLEDQIFRDFEVIIVNDGSTDNTIIEIDNFLKTTSIFVQVISQDNQGVSVARNVGIEKARGKYLYFLDGDDYIHPELFKKCADRIRENNPDLIWFGFDRVSTQGDIIQKFNENFSYYPIFKKGIDILSLLLLKQSSIRIWSAVIRRKIIIEHSMRFFQGCVRIEDSEFLYKILFYAMDLVCIMESLVYYVQRPNSSTATEDIYASLHGLYAWIRLNYFFKEAVNNNTLSKLMETFVMPEYIFHIINLFLNKGHIEFALYMCKQKGIRNMVRKLFNRKKLGKFKNYFKKPIKWWLKYYLMYYWPKVFIITHGIRKKIIGFNI